MAFDYTLDPDLGKEEDPVAFAAILSVARAQGQIEEQTTEKVLLATPLDCMDLKAVDTSWTMASNEEVQDLSHYYSSVPSKGTAVDRKHLVHSQHSDLQLEASFLDSGEKRRAADAVEDRKPYLADASYDRKVSRRFLVGTDSVAGAVDAENAESEEGISEIERSERLAYCQRRDQWQRHYHSHEDDLATDDGEVEVAGCLQVAAAERVAVALVGPMIDLDEDDHMMQLNVAVVVDRTENRCKHYCSDGPDAAANVAEDVAMDVVMDVVMDVAMDAEEDAEMGAVRDAAMDVVMDAVMGVERDAEKDAVPGNQVMEEDEAAYLTS